MSVTCTYVLNSHLLWTGVIVLITVTIKLKRHERARRSLDGLIAITELGKIEKEERKP
jgi:hypothetical protein